MSWFVNLWLIKIDESTGRSSGLTAVLVANWKEQIGKENRKTEHWKNRKGKMERKHIKDI